MPSSSVSPSYIPLSIALNNPPVCDDRQLEDHSNTVGYLREQVLSLSGYTTQARHPQWSRVVLLTDVSRCAVNRAWFTLHSEWAGDLAAAFTNSRWAPEAISAQTYVENHQTTLAKFLDSESLKFLKFLVGVQLIPGGNPAAASDIFRLLVAAVENQQNRRVLYQDFDQTRHQVALPIVKRQKESSSPDKKIFETSDSTELPAFDTLKSQNLLKASVIFNFYGFHVLPEVLNNKSMAAPKFSTPAIEDFLKSEKQGLAHKASNDIVLFNPAKSQRKSFAAYALATIIKNYQENCFLGANKEKALSFSQVRVWGKSTLYESIYEIICLKTDFKQKNRVIVDGRLDKYLANRSLLKSWVTRLAGPPIYPTIFEKFCRLPPRHTLPFLYHQFSAELLNLPFEKILQQTSNLLILEIKNFLSTVQTKRKTVKILINNVECGIEQLSLEYVFSKTPHSFAPFVRSETDFFRADVLKGISFTERFLKSWVSHVAQVFIKDLNVINRKGFQDAPALKDLRQQYFNWLKASPDFKQWCLAAYRRQYAILCTEETDMSWFKNHLDV